MRELHHHLLHNGIVDVVNPHRSRASFNRTHDPARCLVFEDTDMGIEAATRAGMASVRVLQPWQR